MRLLLAAKADLKVGFVNTYINNNKNNKNNLINSVFHVFMDPD